MRYFIWFSSALKINTAYVSNQRVSNAMTNWKKATSIFRLSIYVLYSGGSYLAGRRQPHGQGLSNTEWTAVRISFSSCKSKECS